MAWLFLLDQYRETDTAKTGPFVALINDNR